MSTSPAKFHDVQPDGFFTRTLAETDPAVFAGVAHELAREQHQIELIASENIVSKAVLEAQGSVFTNKYAEGYPGKRYYQGCAPSDELKRLRLTVRSSCSMLVLPMFSRIRARRPTAL